MTLYEVAIPEVSGEEAERKTLKELLSRMEQFYAGMLSASGEGKGEKSHFTLELAVPDGGSQVLVYAAVPDHKKSLFEKHILSIFPHAQIKEQKDDYNVFIDGGVSVGSRAGLAKNSIFPIKTYDEFDYDPFNVVVNAFSKIKTAGEGAALQVVFHPAGEKYLEKFKTALQKLQKGVPPKEALDVSFSATGEFLKTAKDIFKTPAKKKKDEPPRAPDQLLVETIQKKVGSAIPEANIRIVASAGTPARAEEIARDIESAFSQFENTNGNTLSFSRLSGSARTSFFKDFSFREFRPADAVPLSVKELTTLVHLPTAGVKGAPQFKHAKAGTAPAPADVPHEGTFLGFNKDRNVETEAFLTKEDRLRHFYVIGQTGTGKTTLLKNMIIQDIEQGEGVCFIDPHGTDVLDILSRIPERRFDDVIYFDPAYVARAFALNMLQYDEQYPEQKTFVVNELFSIFQKLYGAVPESMGPMFEQYFRNATMLVLEHPESGNTLLDVSRVLSDARFRELKLAHSRNPVVNQFWRDIAIKAGGESALENIVPYITSKFDVFIANDFMRPLIAQERSSFNFREIMDGRKILLVNLAKGRLGDINANLIGLIIVGKILMAALSRVDASRPHEIAPFYLYIDEFQNVTTDSIATILSEARKYKLSLTIAHQFIAQLEDKIKNAVFGNVGSLAAFRVGANDAEFLKKQFEPVFSENDLMNLDNLNAYVKLLAHGRPLKPFNIMVPFPPPGDTGRIETLKQLSYMRFGADRTEVDARIREKYGFTI